MGQLGAFGWLRVSLSIVDHAASFVCLLTIVSAVARNYSGRGFGGRSRLTSSTVTWNLTFNAVACFGDRRYRPVRR